MTAGVGRSHVAFVRHDSTTQRWSVDCWCGFEVINLDTFEAADDTSNWHEGKPSLIGRFADA